MKIISENLRYGARIDIGSGDAFRQRYGDGLLVVVGGGRGATVASAGDGGGLWLPLRGRLKVASGEANFTLEPGQVFLSEPELRTQIGGRGASLWLGLVAQRAGWRRVLARASGAIAPETSLVPAWHKAPPHLRRLGVRLARACLARASEQETQHACDDLVGGVLDLQAGFDAMVERCPGRTLAQRQGVFLRLQRVRNHMALSCQQELDVPELARMASYSPWHFIRAFHAVYGETPHAYLVEQRLDRARRLLRSSPLAISEIALAIGFENRCAFSRLFKQRFGVSAAQLRREYGRAGAVRARRCDPRELPVRASMATRPANSGQLALATDF
ncbi:helix-turn-helix domain-containing protein [Tahibacter soli]|uniref:AraC family transcriptional regulator n=1 Tax=Tahibacter soli TaxID=2983605 RepID=A0A9X3YHD7_9GAMM|nr:AraC family transcriptional regulator [Tahibacter soli]MDC8011260.1 AraC family transcriptional regulator [Tahibacter soli]